MSSALIDDRLARRNALVLSLAQALGGANAAVVISTGGLVGQMLAANKAIATLPVTAMVVGMALATLPAAQLMRRYGRRAGFVTGALAGSIGGFTSALSIVVGSFALFSAGAFLCGIYAAFIAYYRFAAADTASDSMKPRVIAWVLTGGLFAALLGPQLVIATKDLWIPFSFAASFVAQGIVGLVAVLVLSSVRLPPMAPPGGEAERPLRVIMREPRFIVAVTCGVVSYAMMAFVMTATPLAMIDCGHSTTDALLAIQWHVIGMFAPSFVTGRLIARFGTERIVAAGLAMLAASALIGLAGTTVPHFWTALILLGTGWNFGYIGATTMITQVHTPAERARTQGANDFIVNGSQAIASFSAGGVLAGLGWNGVAGAVLPAVVIASLALIWLTLTARRQAAA